MPDKVTLSEFHVSDIYPNALMAIAMMPGIPRIGAIHIKPAKDTRLTPLGEKNIPPNIPIWIVESAGIGGDYRGFGYGKILYLGACRYAFQYNALLAAQVNFEKGSTSLPARNLWARAKTWDEKNLIVGNLWMMYIA